VLFPRSAHVSISLAYEDLEASIDFRTLGICGTATQGEVMEWFESLESGLENIVTLGSFCLEAISVGCVIFGLVKTFQLAIKLSRHRYPEFPFIQLRTHFGSWLALALEFQLGADILATTLGPSIEALGQLALIAVVRTFLNYFLNKELEKQFELQEKQRELRNL
jgi:uncharacterized membrane protein